MKTANGTTYTCEYIDSGWYICLDGDKITEPFGQEWSAIEWAECCEEYIDTYQKE